MSIFKYLLTEALNSKEFDSSEELIKTIKSILRKSSISSYKEVKAQDKGFKSPLRLGYKFNSINGNTTISFVGNEKNWINELIREFAKAKINFDFNHNNEIFLIKSSDNVKAESVLSYEAKEELDNGSYGVIGMEVPYKRFIKDTVDRLHYVERNIYKELLSHGFVEWQQVKIDKNKIVYQLVKMEKE